MSEFKRDDLFVEKEVFDVVGSDQIVMKEISLLLNSDNQIRKFGIVSSLSIKLNKIRYVMILISFILCVNLAPCDQLTCGILSAIGVSLGLIYILVSKLTFNEKVPVRQIAPLKQIYPITFQEHKYEPLIQRVDELIDQTRPFLQYGPLICHLQWFMNETHEFKTDDIEKNRVFQDDFGVYVVYRFKEVMDSKVPNCDDFNKSKIFLSTIHNLKKTDKDKVHLIIDGVEVNYQNICFRLYTKSRRLILEERTQKLKMRNEEYRKSAEEENRRRWNEKIELDQRKKREIIARNTEIIKENQELVARRNELQENFDTHHLNSIEAFINRMTRFYKICSVLKAVVIIICLIFSALVFIYKTSCSGKFCGYSGLSISIIIPFEFLVWLKCKTDLIIYSGVENVDKGVITQSSSIDVKQTDSRFDMFKIVTNATIETHISFLNKRMN